MILVTVWGWDSVLLFFGVEVEIRSGDVVELLIIH